MALYQLAPAIYKQTINFTTTGVGEIFNTGNNPIKNFAIQVVPTGVAPSWTVRFQVSIDGINFTNLLAHSTTTGANTILYSTSPSPALYFRANCTNLDLATTIAVIIIGSN